jgi:hypothetical protein
MYSALSKGLRFKFTTGATLASTPLLNILEEASRCGEAFGQVLQRTQS